jgi:hypothetical protein
VEALISGSDLIEFGFSWYETDTVLPFFSAFLGTVLNGTDGQAKEREVYIYQLWNIGSCTSYSSYRSQEIQRVRQLQMLR